MKTAIHLLAVVTITATAAAAQAQFVKGNEAVRLMPDGSRKVETPPLPTAGRAIKSTPCPASAGCHPGPWHMVETSTGLRECTEPFARPTTCRQPTYGSQKLSRLWITKKGGAWLWCQYPDTNKKCVAMNARPPLNLPVSAVQ